MRMPSSSRSL
ncbi:hypothetical protein GMOD_00006052 [Pyrenophora seminiperda CCB06]|uniref:Uncharacterized protein n=1 Tax=Pyrenophora seminiperda CCB06 TaxID=1302712 RepID=A0A3M7M455_9PLEO|nr:hypothetical protein GMOD_00006052 [Pyrenophora seminiperda CCB06]